MSMALNKWLAYYRPLFGGRFDFHRGEGAPRFDGWLQGLGMLGGRFWVRILGGHSLRRSTGPGAPPLASPLCGRSDAANVSVKTIAAIFGNPDGRYIYRLTGVGAGGQEADDVGALATVTIKIGALLGALPNTPDNLVVTPLANGSFKLAWRFVKTGGATPTHWKIYTDGGTGAMDWVTPLATVAYAAGPLDYNYTTAVLAAAETLWQFAVRAVLTADSELNVRIESARGTNVAPVEALKAYADIGPGGGPSPGIG